jgi:NAD(P)-dependent dehydrogenase (short-subunit alcohol dehydrogenase family)
VAAWASDKVVVVTGASAGIGAALAEELARRGARLVLAARRREPLEAVAARAGGAEVVPTDVTRRDEVERLRDAALARFGHIDAWINNAGRGITRPFERLSDEDVDQMVRDNLKSALYGMQAVLPHLKARQGGVIANVSSMLSRVPFATVRSAYSAAKAALDSLTESLRFELAQEFPRIRVVLVLPGVVATDFGKNALGGGPDSRALPGAQPVEEVARLVADGLWSGPLDLYTRPDGLARVLEHLQGLARGGGTPGNPVPGRPPAEPLAALRAAGYDILWGMLSRQPLGVMTT